MDEILASAPVDRAPDLRTVEIEGVSTGWGARWRTGGEGSFVG
jgi:hypothetical protein